MTETTSTPQKPGFTKPGFIAAAIGAVLMLVGPVMSFGPMSINGIDIVTHIGEMDTLFGILFLGAVLMFILNAFLIFDGGKNENLKKSLDMDKREKMKMLPLTMMAAIIGYGIVDVGIDFLKVMGILGFWVPFLAGIFLAAEDKIMGMIKK